MVKEAMLMKEVWVPSESPFTFSEQIKDGEKKFILKGLMLPFGKISRNSVLYNIDSIKEKYKQLIGRPLMYNHKVDGEMLPKGHFVNSWIEDDGWHYEADIDPNEKEFIRKLQRGDLRHVSIQLVGGKVLERLNNTGQSYTEAWVKDIIEGSVVPAPGFLDTTARFAEALHPKKRFKELRNPEDYPKDVWNKAQDMTVRDADKFLDDYDKTHKEDVTTTTGDGAIQPTQTLEDKKKVKEGLGEQRYDEIEKYLRNLAKQGVDINKAIKQAASKFGYSTIEIEEVADGIDEFYFEKMKLKEDNIYDDVNLNGLADKKNITEKDVDPKELEMGIKVEMEHTGDKEIAKKIALDHLAEIKDYYTRLAKMEQEAEAESIVDEIGEKEVEEMISNY